MRNTIRPRTTGPTERPFCWAGPCTQLHNRGRDPRSPSNPGVAHHVEQHQHKQPHHSGTHISSQTPTSTSFDRTPPRVEQKDPQRPPPRRCRKEGRAGALQKDGHLKQPHTNIPADVKQRGPLLDQPIVMPLTGTNPHERERASAMPTRTQPRPPPPSLSLPSLTSHPLRPPSIPKHPSIDTKPTCAPPIANHTAYLVFGVGRPCACDVAVKLCLGHLEALRGDHRKDRGGREVRNVGQDSWKWKTGAPEESAACRFVGREVGMCVGRREQ